MLLLSALVLDYIDGPIRRSSSLFLLGLNQLNCDVSLIDSKMSRICWPQMLAARRRCEGAWSFGQAFQATNRK